MRIVFLTQLLPLPLDAGPKIRSYYVLSYLAEAGHDITLLSFVRPGDSDEHIRSLGRLCRSVHPILLTRSRVRDLSHGLRSLVSATPFLILRDQFPEMKLAIERVAGKRSADALHADQLWMAPYSPDRRLSDLTVLDQHNAVFVVLRRMSSHQPSAITRAFVRREAAKLESFERTACARFDTVVWVTEEDRRAVGCGNGHRNRQQVIPIATDPAERRPVKRTHPFRVTFLGGMHWPPNAEGVSWFFRQVWPQVARAVPEAVLTVIGRKPPGVFGTPHDSSRVEVTGYVADLARYLSETAVFVVPLRSGAGMRVKILDAWCWGLPVVSTSLGAEGIRGVAGENLLLADDPDSFAESVIRVMQNREFARRLSVNGRATTESFYDWRKVYTAWDQIYH